MLLMSYRVQRWYRGKSFPELSPWKRYVTTMKLTTKTIQALQPTDRRQEIKDDGCRGLYLLLQSSGAKGWAVRYHLDGRVRKVTLGIVPADELGRGAGRRRQGVRAAGRRHRSERSRAAGGGRGEGGADADLRRAGATVHRRQPASEIGQRDRPHTETGDRRMGGPADCRTSPARRGGAVRWHQGGARTDGGDDDAHLAEAHVQLVCRAGRARGVAHRQDEAAGAGAGTRAGALGRRGEAALGSPATSAPIPSVGTCNCCC